MQPLLAAGDLNRTTPSTATYAVRACSPCHSTPGRLEWLSSDTETCVGWHIQMHRCLLVGLGWKRTRT